MATTNNDTTVPTQEKKKPVKPKTAAKGAAKDAPKKGPGKKAIAQIREALEKQKEEEAKVQFEEEEKIRKLEEAEEAKRLQVQREKERKEKKKLRDKERKQKLKAEGKILSAKQKFERERAQTLLNSLKQGTIISEVKVEEKHGEQGDAEEEEISSSENESEVTDPPLSSLPKVRVQL
jgi:translation initiation factor 5B